MLTTSPNLITGVKEAALPPPKKGLKPLSGILSSHTTPQSKRQTFDCVLLPSPCKSKLAKPPGTAEGLPRSQTTSPIPNATASQVAALQQTLRPMPRLLFKDMIIEDDGQSPSKRVEKRAKKNPLISWSDWEDEYDSESEVLPMRGSVMTRKGKEGAQVVQQGRGWVVVAEDVTPDEEPIRPSKAEQASARTSRSQARRRHSLDVHTPAKRRSKRGLPTERKQMKGTPQRAKPASPVPSSPSNPFDSIDQSDATTNGDSESGIDPGAETDTTSYSLKFSDPLIAQSPRSTTSSLAVPVPSDFETDVEEPEDYTPAIRQSSTVALSIKDGATEDDPEMELDGPDFRPVLSQSKVLRGPLPHHLYHFVSLQKRAVLQRLRNPPYIELSRDRVINEAGKELRGLLEGTMERGEGNSCLILGPRGSGKSLVSHHCPLVHRPLIHSSVKLVETTLRGFAKKAIVIRLSGHAQATDRHAMREIAYQLNHQTGSSFAVPEDDVEDMTPGGEEEDIQYNFAPPAAYLPTLISQLPTLSRPVLVLLDAFDLFIQHPRQALLYCLLDTVQSCRAGPGRNGLLVVGMTTKVNCINLLEKRVKSRFSQRVLRVPSFTCLDGVVHFVKTILSPGLERLEPEEALQEWNQIWADNVQVRYD
jgi:hypothetical protein